MKNHDSGRSARKEQIRGRLPLQTAQEQSVENDTDVSSGEPENTQGDLQTGWELEAAFARMLAGLVEKSNPQGEKGDDDADRSELGYGRTVLDKRNPYWILSCVTSEVTLRLLIERGELNYIESPDVVIFQVVLPGATSYKTLGELCVKPCLFTPDIWWTSGPGDREEEEGELLGYLRRFPHDWRADFTWMVSRWGQHRLLSAFQETVREMPHEDCSGLVGVESREPPPTSNLGAAGAATSRGSWQ